MKKNIFVVIILLVGGLSLYSQSYNPVTFIADDEDYVWGKVHIGDIIEFQQPNNSAGNPTKKGIVFYINPERTEGWAVEQTNTSSNTRWNNNSYYLIDIPTFSTAQVNSLLSDVDGYNNTRLIRQYYGLAPYMDGNYAAGLVDFKNKWYLPAAGQLMKLYGALPLLEQGAAITGFTTLNRGTSTGNARYWSSTQSSNTQAWYVQGWNSASSGGNLASYSKGQAMAVRAVRTFKLKPSKLSYLWSPTGDTIPDIIITPRETTEYCVTVTYGDLQCAAEACQTIEVNPTIAGNDYMTICEGELPFEWNGVIFTEAGTQTCSIPSSMSDCDSIVHLHLSVNPNLYGDYYREICENQLPYTWHGITFTGSGEHTITVVNATPQGCDSVVTLHLIVNQSEEEEFTVTECDSYTWIDGNGQTYTSSGTYTFETETVQGCPRTETLHLTINQSEEYDEFFTSCDSFTWADGNGQTYTTSGSYVWNTTTPEGCDKIVTLHLTINQSEEEHFYVTECDSYYWHGTWYDCSGTYTYETTTAQGCQRIEILQLTVNQSYEVNDMHTLCQGETYTWQGHTFGMEAGEFTVTERLPMASGCDSIVTMTVMVNDAYEVEDSHVLCQGGTYEWQGHTFGAESGTFTVTEMLSTVSGCDSIVHMTVTVNAVYEVEDTHVLCQGDSWTWEGHTFGAEAGEFPVTETLPTATGCDSVVTMTVTVNPPTHNSETVTSCDSYVWHGQTYSESDTYLYVYENEYGCRSVDTLHLTINQYSETTQAVTACDSYTWVDGVTYTQSTTAPTYTFTSQQDCDSIVHLHLTVNPSYEFNDNHTICEGDEYVWEGHDFSGYASGVYSLTETLSSIGNCDSIVHMTVTVNDSYWVEDRHVLCQGGMYEWQGHTFGAEAGTFMVTETLPTASGCDSIVTKIVTVYPSYEVCDSYVLCQGGTYVWQGHSFGATAGEFTVTETLPTVSGCDSIVTMYVNVNPVQTYTDAVTICDDALPYTFHGHVFNAAGTQTGTVPSTVTSCDSTWTLTVNVNPSEYDEEWITECDTYTWHGTAYLQSGSYTYSTYTAQGCERIETLHLTINNSEEEEYTVTASDSYMWHGMTYTQSGTYYYETSTAQGCPRTEILYLTIASNHWTPVGENTSPFSTTLYGIIQINGVEQYSDQLELGIFCGNECRGSAIASEFFLTHRYLVEANVYGNSGEQLTFKLYDHAIHQELSLTPPDAITFTIDGYGNPVNPYVLNFTSSMSITATTAPENAGTVTGTGEYTIGSSCSLTATANPGFQFQNWTLDGTVVSTNPTYTFTVTENANYVAHFQYVQRRTLVSGWNWWSTYIEQEGSNGLEMLENSIGTSGIRIQGKNSSVDYFEYQGTGYWYGSLNTIANEQMYMIRTSAACDAVIVGDVALPENHPITIISGWNWIGYPNAQSVDVNIAMGGFTPEANDVVKGRNSVSTYISYGGYQGWYGQLNTLEPGQGYMYRSYSNSSKTLTFQTGRGGETLANITPENNVFVPNTANYADNMIVTAVIDMDGEELRSEDYELAVFVGNECRGSVRLMYVEPFDRYVALLMAYGEGEEELRFVLTDGKGTSWSNDRVTYTANGMVGTMTEPAIIHFGPLGIEDNIQKPIHVYPNPSKGIFNIEGEGIQKIEVVDIYGQVILSKEVKSIDVQVDLSDSAAGAYLLRVVTEKGITTHKLMKNY